MKSVEYKNFKHNAPFLYGEAARAELPSRERSNTAAANSLWRHYCHTPATQTCLPTVSICRSGYEPNSVMAKPYCAVAAGEPAGWACRKGRTGCRSRTTQPWRIGKLVCPAHTLCNIQSCQYKPYLHSPASGFILHRPANGQGVWDLACIRAVAVVSLWHYGMTAYAQTTSP